MKIILVALSLISILWNSQCSVIKKDDTEDTSPVTETFAREGEPEDINQVLKDISKFLIGDDEKLVKDIVQEINEEMSDSSKEFLEGLKKQFVANLVRLTGGGELYRDARREAILRSLQAALETTGDSDSDFLAELTRKIRRKEQLRRQKPKDFESNKLKSVTEADEQ